MILKRHKFRVEQATFSLKQAMVSRDRSLKIDLPRRETGVKEAVEKAELALAKAQDMQPLMLSQKRLALNKLNYEQNKAEKRLAELVQDREALTVKAPADGLAYHGRYVNGQWMVASGMQGPKLLGGGPIMSDEVFLTIVAPRPLAVRAEVEEKDLHGLKTGVAAKVTPTAFPDKKLTGKLVKKAAAPLNGRFVVRIELEDETSEGIVPGMSCSVRIVTAQKDAALTVPASAVFTDDDEETRYVYLAAASGKPEKKTVKVGLTVGERVEILDGLAEGDEILATKP
jgi:multidrug efflux pump subunit AcrA (membrane-fusion protein)